MDDKTRSEITARDKRNRYLCKRIKENDLSAGNDIIDENENLIKTVIQKLRKYYGTDNIEIDNIDEDDLMQEGRIALMNAAKTFDEDRIVKFSTYAVTVLMRRLISFFTNDKGYEKNMISAGYARVYLDDNKRDEEKLLTIEKTVYGRRDPTGDLAVFRIMIEKLGNRLVQLSARQLQLITYLYGFRTRKTPTIIETAKHFHLTERHLKSIERKALNELRDGMNDGRII